MATPSQFDQSLDDCALELVDLQKIEYELGHDLHAATSSALSVLKALEEMTRRCAALQKARANLDTHFRELRETRPKRPAKAVA